jgi:Flp pilus assembly pilin Flp
MALKETPDVEVRAMSGLVGQMGTLVLVAWCWLQVTLWRFHRDERGSAEQALWTAAMALVVVAVAGFLLNTIVPGYQKFVCDKLASGGMKIC